VRVGVHQTRQQDARQVRDKRAIEVWGGRSRAAESDPAAVVDVDHRVPQDGAVRVGWQDDWGAETT
jgi:hypothetical protein